MPFHCPAGGGGCLHVETCTVDFFFPDLLGHSGYFWLLKPNTVLKQRPFTQLLNLQGEIKRCGSHASMCPKLKLNVHAFPRPPLLEKVSRHLQVKWNGHLIADSKDAYWVLETTHPPSERPLIFSSITLSCDLS